MLKRFRSCYWSALVEIALMSDGIEGACMTRTLPGKAVFRGGGGEKEMLCEFHEWSFSVFLR